MVKKVKDIENNEENEYILYLKERKDLGKVKMTGKFKGVNKSTEHECEYSDCKRKWKPTPKRMMSEIGYCPSCVRSWSNGENRFDKKPWAAKVPNTIYYYQLEYEGQRFYKIGRTEEKDADERFPKKERDLYNMILIDSKRLTLIESIKAENRFKKIANLIEFPDKDFHGKNETFQCDFPNDIWERCLNQEKVE